MKRREQEPPGERREVMVSEKMEEPGAGWEMKTDKKTAGQRERERERCAIEESSSRGRGKLELTDWVKI